MSDIDITKVLTPEIRAKIKVQRKFEIAIEEQHETDDGIMTWRPVTIDPKLGGNGRVIITASSPDDLKSQQQIYAQAGQRFRIIQQIDPPSDETLYKLAVEQGLVSADTVQTNTDVMPTGAHDNITDDTQRVIVDDSQLVHRPTVKDTAVKPQKVRYYSVGDIEIKDDNGTLYQKQWMKLTPAEAANFRIVNDTNNKIIALNGKHIEAKRWILVENDSSSDANINVDNIING